MRTSTSLIVMWKLLSIIETWTTYVISYLNTNNTQCFFDANFITDISSSERMHTLSNLQEATEYSITVSVILNDKKIYKQRNDLSHYTSCRSIFCRTSAYS